MTIQKLNAASLPAAKWLAPSLLGLAVLAGNCSADTALMPPPGYLAPIEKVKSGDAPSCEPAPKPFTGPLQFRSKYEGSDKSRSTLNEDSEEAFRDSTADITTLEKGTSKMVMQYMRDGHPETLNCVLGWLTTWAQADALESKDFDHTGKSERKWALASMSSAYLHLKFSSSHPLADHQQQAQVIEAWFSKLGTQVVSDWNNLPLEKNNNHTYWAAWAAMSASVVTNRRDLFDWSVKEFKYGASQLDPQGFLPNEVKRQQRALAYHNYAIGPLMMIASFAQANNVDLRGENNGALQRLAQHILAGAKDPSDFAARAGVAQDMKDVSDPSKYAWLEPYCTLYTCTPEELDSKHSKEPFKSFRLGGDLTRVYDPTHEKGSGS